MCNGRLEFAGIERAHDIRFRDRFRAELDELLAPGGPVADGLVTLHSGGLELTEIGRLFVRNVAMVFDRHLRAAGEGTNTFSRTV